VTARWLDLVDPTRDELLATLPVPVDPEVVETLAERPGKGRAPRPLLEGHGPYVFGVFLAARPIPHEDRTDYLEIDVIATPTVLVTVRKTPIEGGAPFDASALHPAAEQASSAGVLVHRLVDEVVDSFVDSNDAVYAEIEELEDNLETWSASRVRVRISDLRHELLHSRKIVSSTRATIRRILDGRIEVGEHALFPSDVERLFADTYETLVRTTEELDIARDLLGGVSRSPSVARRRGPGRRGEEAHGHRVARARSEPDRRVLRPELRVCVRRRLLVDRRLQRSHRPDDAGSARDLSLAPLDLSRDDGHRSSTTHSSQSGRRASQMRRPCQMSR
jgi:hypothetical protein